MSHGLSRNLGRDIAAVKPKRRAGWLERAPDLAGSEGESDTHHAFGGRGGLILQIAGGGIEQ
jgi:hypothetical protein